MDKFIRAEVRLNEEELDNIKKSFEHKNFPFKKISKKIELKDFKTNLRLFIDKKDEKICVTITYLDKIILFKECSSSINEVLELYVSRKMIIYF